LWSNRLFGDRGMRMKKSVSLYAFVFAVSLAVAQMACAIDFTQLENCPRAVNRAYGNIAVRALLDGRLLVWDGDALYVQKLLSGDGFNRIASGYAGDVGFMAISPDGHTALLGAGISGKLYKFDVQTPVDYSSAADLGVVSHYWGAFISNTLVVIDKLTDDYTTDELVIIDISKTGLARKRVMLKPMASQIPSGGFGASAELAVDASLTYLYAMAPVFDSSFMVVSNPLKRIAVSALIGAYNADALLDWDTDAQAIGAETAYASGGPAAVMSGGDLLIVGFGGVQRVRPGTGAIVETYAPAGGVYYGASYNPATGDILPLATDTAGYTLDLVYAPEGRIKSLPVLGGLGLVGLAAAIGLAGRRRL